jgi:hypothetical protein
VEKEEKKEKERRNMCKVGKKIEREKRGRKSSIERREEENEPVVAKRK